MKSTVKASLAGRYFCQETVLGPELRRAVSKLRVAVVGLGGTGSTTSILLAQLGIAQLRLIDFDTVQASNLSRQTLYVEKSVGKLKTSEAKRKLAEINSGVKLVVKNVKLTEKNAASLIRGVDFVLDCTDNYEARVAINRACLKLRVPWVYCAAIRDRAMLLSILPGFTPCFECFAPKPTLEMQLSCSEAGIIPTTTTLASSLQVQELINLLAGFPNYAGRIVHFNFSTGSMSAYALPVKRCKHG